MQKTVDRIFEDEHGKLDVKSTQLPAMRSFKLLAKLGKLLGPALGQLRGVKLQSDTSKLLPALTALLSTLDPDDADALVTQVLEGTIAIHGAKVVELGKAGAVDAVFTGRLILMLKVMAFAVEVNFVDFFRGLAPGAAVPAVPAESP